MTQENELKHSDGQAALASKPQVTEGEIRKIVCEAMGGDEYPNKGGSITRALLQQFEIMRK